MPKNDTNKIAERGIENLFDESLFEGLITTVNDSRNKERKTFDTSRKKDFAQKVIKRNNKADFIKFESLIQKITDIRGDKLNTE